MLKPLLSSQGKYLRARVAIFMVDQLVCIVSMVAWTTNRNSTGARLSPCLTPEIKLQNSASSILIMILQFPNHLTILPRVFCHKKGDISPFL